MATRDQDGLFDDRAQLPDAAWRASVGARLAAARAAAGLTHAAVADRLLLSTRQVRALEAGTMDGFYNAGFYLKALRNYGAWLGVETRESGDSRGERPEPHPPHPVPEDMDDRTLAEEPIHLHDVPDAPGWNVSRVAILGVLVAGVAAYAWFPARPKPPVVPAPVVTTPSLDVQPPPAAPPAVATDGGATGGTGGVEMGSPAARSTEPETAVPAPSNAIAGATSAPPALPAVSADAVGALTVSKATWVFVRYADGTVFDRSVADGETVAIVEPPIYIAAGLPSVTLTLAGRRVDVSPYVSNGQVRVRAGDLAQLLIR